MEKKFEQLLAEIEKNKSGLYKKDFLRYGYDF